MTELLRLSAGAVLKALGLLLIVAGLALVITALMEPKNTTPDGGLTPPPPIRQTQPQHTDNA